MVFKSVSQIRKELSHARAPGGAAAHGTAGYASQPTASAGHASPGGHAPEEKNFVPVFVPMGRTPGADTMNCRGRSGVPVHTLDVLTRGDVMEELTDDSMRSGNIAAAYKSWLLAVIFFVLTIASMFINVYLAGLTAYLTGFYYSERLLNQSWGVEWFKGKSLTYTV